MLNILFICEYMESNQKACKAINIDSHVKLTNSSTRTMPFDTTLWQHLSSHTSLWSIQSTLHEFIKDIVSGLPDVQHHMRGPVLPWMAQIRMAHSAHTSSSSGRPWLNRPKTFEPRTTRHTASRNTIDSPCPLPGGEGAAGFQ